MSVAHLAMEHVSDPVTEQTGFWEVSARNESPESGRMVGYMEAIANL